MKTFKTKTKIIKIIQIITLMINNTIKTIKINILITNSNNFNKKISKTTIYNIKIMTFKCNFNQIITLIKILTKNILNKIFNKTKTNSNNIIITIMNEIS